MPGDTAASLLEDMRPPLRCLALCGGATTAVTSEPPWRLSEARGEERVSSLRPPLPCCCCACRVCVSMSIR